MASAGSRFVASASKFARSIGNALDKAGQSLEVAKVSEKLVPSTRFVAVDNLAPTAEGAFVAPTANLIGDVQVGKGASVWYGATVRGDVNAVTIGERSSIGDRAVVHVAKIQGDYPTSIGKDVTVGAGAIIHAATLKDRVVVGAGAQVLDGSVVESGAIVSPGAVVTPKTVIQSNELWAGNPAKKVRDLTDEELATIEVTAEETMELAAVHASECAKSYEQLVEDDEQYFDKLYRDPDYYQPPKAGETVEEDFDVAGRGVPGRIFNSNLNAPEEMKMWK